MPNYVVADVETGGVDFENGLSHKLYPITEIAMNVCDPVNFKTSYNFHTYVKPYNNLTITPDALKHSGVDIKEVEKGMDLKKLVANMIIVAKKANKSGRERNRPILVGHNFDGYDLGFFEEAFELVGKNLYDYFNKRTIDTLTLAELVFAMSGDDITSNKLKDCCKKMGIKLTNAHSAQNDTDATQKLLKLFVSKLRNTSAVNTKEEPEKAENHRKYFKF